jgi:hypothetical protein
MDKLEEKEKKPILDAVYIAVKNALNAGFSMRKIREEVKGAEEDWVRESRVELARGAW